MQIEQLKYLVEVAKTSSISQAAENLFISQPAVSISLKNLEKELGITLFKRTKNGIFLTLQGQSLSTLAKNFLHQYKVFENDVYTTLSDQQDQLDGTLYIEAVPNISYSILPTILSTFMKQHSKIQISIIEKNNDDIAPHVTSGSCDLGIIVYTDASKEKYDGLQLFPLITSKHYILTSAQHPLATRSQVYYKDLLAYKLITHSFHKDDTFLEDSVFCGNPPEIILRSSSMQIILQNISQTENISILSHLLLDYALLKQYNIIAIPVADSMSIRFGGLFHQNSPNSNVIQHFLSQFAPYC